MPDSSEKRPSDPDIRDLPGRLIRRAQQIAVAIFIEECQAQNITPVQYAALKEIGREPGLDATRLAQLAALDRSTLSAVLVRLEAKAWVERRASAEDRRVKLLFATREGLILLRDVADAVETTQARIMSPLAAREVETFLRLLTKLVEGNNAVSRAPLGAEDETNEG